MVKMGLQSRDVSYKICWRLFSDDPSGKGGNIHPSVEGLLIPLDIVILHAIINSSSHMGDQTRQANRRMLQSGQKTLLLGARQWSLNLR